MKNHLAVRREFWGLLLGVLILFGLYVISLYNYLLFHILAELFSIVVACGIFLLAWNSQRFLDNTYLLFIGVAYLFIGATDLVHTLSYKGMGIFQGFDANLPTQLWIAGRYVQSLSFLAGFFFLNRRPNTRLVFSGYTLVTSLLFLSIFYWKIFPTCFVEGKGLTPFKITSEYLICLFLIASIFILFKYRQKFDRAVRQWLILSLLTTVGSELFFTFYISVYGLSNLSGHLLKILSFFFIYKAIIETGLAKPYTLLFRNLREERDKAQTYLDIAGVIFLVITPDQTVALINKKGREVLGYEEKEIIGKNWFDTFLPEGDRERVKQNFIKLISGEIETIEYSESLVLTKGAEERIVAWHNTVLRNEKNQIIGTLSSGEDITKNKEMEKILAHLASFPKLNPNPIVEVDFNGSLHYLNPAAQQLFSKAQTKDVQREWLADLGSIIRNVQSQNKISSEREIQINENWYHQSFHVIPGLDRIRIYSLDITERKRMEEELRKSRDELEIKVQERTAEVSKAYEKLREQSTILEAFFSSTVTPLVFLDRDFNFVRVNEAYAKACRRDVSEFPGKNHFELYPSDAKAKFEQVLQTKEPYAAIAKPFTFPDHPEWGTTYWDWTLTPILDDRGEVEFLVFSLEDVTKRKRAEEALRAASLYARNLIESSLDPLVTISRDGKVMDVNRTTELVTGFSRAELIGTDFSDYFTEPEKAREGYQRVFLEGSVRDYPLAIKDRSGRLTEVLYHATVYRNETGEIQGVFAAARDVTERNEIGRRVQATNALLYLFSKLSHFKEYLDAAVNLLSVWSGCRCVGIRVLNPKGYIPYESYVGFSREFWELENFLSIQRDQCACVRVIRGELEPQEACVVTPGGSFCCGNTLKFIEALSEEERARYRGNCMKYRFLSVAIVPIRYKEKIVGAVHLADEGEGRITFKSVEFIESMAPLIGEAVHRFKLEEELRESENRLRLLSSRLLTVQEQERKRVAHELHDGIGQMLTAVKFKVEDTLQQMARSRSKPKQALETIVPVIQQTVEEVRRIQMDLRPSLLDDIGILSTIGWFTREFQKVFTTLQIEKRIDILEEQVPDSLKVVIFRVIQEALNNIAKHSKADLASLSLKKSDGKLELAIGDNGQGFDLDGARSKESPEKGFGLTSMRERTELSGGTFSIESTIGKGTTIRASWPL